MNGFPRTQVGGVSVSRMIIGTNWFLGWSHASPAKDAFIKESIANRKVIADILDANVSYFSASPTPSGGTAQDTPYWNIGDVAPGAPGQITLRALVDSPLPNNTILTNTASITCDQTISSAVVETTPVHSAPILYLTKSDTPDPVDAGTTLTYTLTYSNTGNGCSTGQLQQQCFENNRQVTRLSPFDTDSISYLTEPEGYIG